MTALGLGKLQASISALYDLDVGCAVEDFVCGPETVRETLGDGSTARREVLVVAEDPLDTFLGLYLSPEVLTALEEGVLWDERNFEPTCLAAEGVSHFVYFLFRAGNREQVSQLELELQAEVDKYALALFSRSRDVQELAGNGVYAIARSRALRERLYDSVRFVDAASSEEGARYRLANQLAARYTASLERRFVESGRLSPLETELRRFYRLGLVEKMERAAG